jgi:hypothetical protein
MPVLPEKFHDSITIPTIDKGSMSQTKNKDPPPAFSTTPRKELFCTRTLFAFSLTVVEA